MTAQGKLQPLQWNIGSVHRYDDAGLICVWASIARLWRYAPRCEYMTPFGRPVVPEV